nr:hypothetical protein CE91St29_07120 [Corynebacterium striatum]
MLFKVLATPDIEKQRTKSLPAAAPELGLSPQAPRRRTGRPFSAVTRARSLTIFRSSRGQGV